MRYLLYSFPIASFGLGVWQIKRLQWKKDLIANLESRSKQPPLDISEIKSLNDLSNLEYTKVKVRGYYDQDPNHQIYLRPRMLITNKESMLRGHTDTRPSIGVNVVTPFQVENDNLKILVNRGWLAVRGNKDTIETDSHLGMGDIGQIVELVGILRLPERKTIFGQHHPSHDMKAWPTRDIDAFSKLLNTSTIYLDLESNKTATRGPIAGQTQLKVRNEHLSYAFVWFSLSVISYLMLPVRRKG